MSDGQNAIEVFESRRFGKALKKLPDAALKVVEDEIDRLIANPLLGEQKKGDLAFLRVHKFPLNRQQMLLAYSWQQERLHLFQLSFGSHENFYDDLKRLRDVDLKLVDG